MATRKSFPSMPHSASEKHIVKRSWMPAPFLLFPLQSRIPCCETFWLRCGMWHAVSHRRAAFFRLLVSITDESSSLCFRQFYAWCVEGKILLQSVSGAPRPLFLRFSVAIAFPYPLLCIVRAILWHTVRFAFLPLFGGSFFPRCCTFVSPATGLPRVAVI